MSAVTAFFSEFGLLIAVSTWLARRIIVSYNIAHATEAIDAYLGG